MISANDREASVYDPSQHTAYTAAIGDGSG